ncbi:tautomerase family protein [Streptomyces chartreusis]|uniref:tautomerase family protein n=1 Tax=Streptomyces chartreusis TaxID=1969 RepID=UPI003D90D31C
MPFVDICLVRGKSPEYLKAVSDSVHQALVEGLGMVPEDRFQLIHEFDRDRMVFPENFRGGPRTDDFATFKITDRDNRDTAAKERFYPMPARLLEKSPGINPQDVFVMMYGTTMENFSFAGGVPGTELARWEGHPHTNDTASA